MNLTTKADTESLTRLLQHYSEMSDTMKDVYDSLLEGVPENSSLSFCVRDLPIVQIDVTGDNSKFAEAFFLSWYRYYQNKIGEVASLLEGVAIRRAG